MDTIYYLPLLIKYIHGIIYITLTSGLTLYCCKAYKMDKGFNIFFITLIALDLCFQYNFKLFKYKLFYWDRLQEPNSSNREQSTSY